MSTPPTRPIFKTPGITSAQWSRISRECAYEAEKATAAAGPRTPTAYTKGRLFKMCAELKGATFVGRVTMTDEQWNQISASCGEEADRAVAGQPASRAKDERREDLEIECARRKGVVFHPL